MKISVIYIIKSKVQPEKFYIGSAVNFYQRIRNHKSDLVKKKHCSKHLQNHVNKYGIKDISFEILERVYDKNNLISREQYYLDLYKPIFNTCKIAGSPLGTKHSEETKIKCRKC